MILAALWCNKVKPTMNNYLKPVVESASDLYTKGTSLTELAMGVVLITLYSMGYKCTCFRFLHGCMGPVNSISLILMTGIEVSTPSGVQTVKAALVAISCDLPARALVLNMRQFNGAEGCHLCEDPGQTAVGNHLFRWWPPNPSNVLRSKESLSADAIKATMEGKIVSEHAVLTTKMQWLPSHIFGQVSHNKNGRGWEIFPFQKGGGGRLSTQCNVPL